MSTQEKAVKKAKTGVKKLVFYGLLLTSGSIGCLGTLWGHRQSGLYSKKIIISPESIVNMTAPDINIASVDNQSSADETSYLGREDDGFEVVSETETVYPTKEIEAQVYDVTEGGIHRYEYCKNDCTWTQALNSAVAAGGYLARINSQEEFEYILNQLSESKFDGMVMFQIGARRDPSSDNYYWVSEKNELYGETINNSQNWFYQSLWMDGEPSLSDLYENRIIDEDKVVLCKRDNQWRLNDSSDGIVQNYPFYSGKIGYIVEYEN